MLPRLDLSPSSTLLIVDVQDKLLGAMHPDLATNLLRYTAILIELAQSQGANILYSEQYPAGLGPTAQALRQPLEAAQATRYDKTLFDAVSAHQFAPHLPALGQRVFLCGMEAHICVLSTALTLATLGREVIVPLDAVASRTLANYTNGLDLMRASGATIANAESIIFSTLRDASHPDFKRFSKLIR
jgi:nicotinamidase-related amidase